MRFFALVHSLANASDYIQFSFPSSGILRNIVMKMFFVTDQHINVHFGNFSKKNVEDQPPTAGQILMVKGKNSGDYWRVDTTEYQAEVGQNFTTLFAHRASPMYIRGHTLYGLSVQKEAVSTTAIVYIEGEFVPYEGADYSFTYTFDDIDSLSANYADKHLINQDLDDCYLEVETYVDNASEVAAKLHIMLSSPYDEVISGSLTGKGLMDSAIDYTGDALSRGNRFGDMLIGSAGTGLAFQKKVFPVIKKVYAGDYLAFDMTAIKGTLSGLKAEVTVKGKTRRKGKSVWKTNFFSGLYVANLNEMEIV